MPIRYSAAEIAIIHSNELEQYVMRYPLIGYYSHTTVQSETASRFGKVLAPDNTTYGTSASIQLNADFSFERRVYKIENGIRIKTNQVDVQLCQKQLTDLGVTINEDDLLEIASIKYIVLRVEPFNMIPSTTEFLHLLARIDLQNMVKE